MSADFGNAESETRENANPFCSLSADTAVERVDGMFGEVGSAGEVGQMCIQFANKYIVTSTRGGLLVIDQHRAHLRILYDGYMRARLREDGCCFAERDVSGESDPRPGAAGGS